jgi:hypothetical protein
MGFDVYLVLLIKANVDSPVGIYDVVVFFIRAQYKATCSLIEKLSYNPIK